VPPVHDMSLRRSISPSRWGWALLVAAVLLAIGLRFYQLGEWPPGPYRDEAYNALDALGVLQGDHALFFPANNGREPAYIYLVAAAFALLGPTTMALRFPAALAGALATVPSFLLGRAWFGRTAGVLAAFLWAMTFWPVHLGRIGLRAGLLGPVLAMALWLGTRAYREQRAGLWLAAGLVYGLTFYTYLAARLTPLLLAGLAIYLIATGRRRRLWAGSRSLWFLLGAGLTLAPLAWLWLQDPSLIAGRAGQVSILSPEVNGGNLGGALLRQTGDALGMFLWRGDTILRHNALLNYQAVLPWENPAGRPVFDWFMAGPFLVGLGWSLRHWRRPPAAALLLWQTIMLAPTILAEDAPHFLRAAGLLPGVVFLPAIGLSLLWGWERLPAMARRAAVLALLLGSLVLTVRDYSRYAQEPDVAFLFELAAAELALSAVREPAGTIVYIDERFRDGWPSVRFLLGDRPVIYFRPEQEPPVHLDSPTTIFAWPYGPLDFLGAIIDPPAIIAVATGPAARGDLEPEPYSLYTRYFVTPGATDDGFVAQFGDGFRLRAASAGLPQPDVLALDLRWERTADVSLPEARPDALPNLFIHISDPSGIIAQYDGPLAGGLWPGAWWQPGLSVDEQLAVELPIPFDPAQHQVTIGLYWPETGERLPVLDARGRPVDDRLIIQPAE
jgi:4-amino-4-deoxy-L-arabinose transferase-like glycosyltransferase